MRLLLLLLVPCSLFSQVKFSSDVLNAPRKHKRALEQAFVWKEVGKWKRSGQGPVLEYGYASGDFDQGTSINVSPSSIDTIQIIFTMYPKWKIKWVNNYHELLATRVKSILKLNPSLNTSTIVWQCVVQNDCNSEAEARSLFHGARFAGKREASPTDNSDSSANAWDPNDPLVAYKAYGKEIGGINDSTAYNIVNKTKLPDKAILVIDWTASMHQYGLQVLMWHTMNQSRSPFVGMVLFNDGNMKADNTKTPGKTGGVYIHDLTSPEELVKVMRLVQQQGVGGDNQENDVEAIIEAIKEYPKAENVILIADNNSCMRDIQIVGKVSKPVFPVMCGVLGKVINPQYVKLAYDTKGGLFTIDEQLKSIKLGPDNSTWVNNRKFKRNEFGEFKLADPSLDAIKVVCP